MNMLQVKAVFRKVSNMSIVTDTLLKSCLRFLDLALVSGPVCVYWKFEWRVKKEVQCFSFIHTKVVKLGIAKKCLNLAKSCLHAMDQSFGYQVARLKAEGWGHPDDVVRCVAVECC